MYIEHVVLFISGNVNSLHKQLYGLFIRIVFQGIFDPQRTQQAEPHHAVSGGNAVQIVHAAVEDLQRLAHLLEKPLAELRQLHVAPVLFKQRHTELLLQLHDGVAQARLRYSDRGR